jgi:hypothetical protein
MAAAVDRVSRPESSIDLDALRRDLVAELMHRLRSEFERGA